MLRMITHVYENVALDILLIDHTGPVMATLWAELAKKSSANVAESRARLPENMPFVLCFEIMEVSVLPNN